MTEYTLGVEEGEKLRDDELLADALVLRGEQRYYIGELTGGIQDVSEAYRLYGKLQNNARQMYTLNAMANIYADGRVAQYDRALEYYGQLLAAHKAAKSEALVAEDYFNIGSTLQQQGKLQEALVQFGYGLALDLERGDQDEVATDRRAIGIVLYKLNRPAEALRMFDLALARVRRGGNAESIAALRLSRGVALRMLGKPKEALQELNEARTQFIASNSKRFLQKAESERALVLASMGRWSEAYAARTADMELQDTLNAQSRGEQTSRMRLQFDLERKDQENQALQLQNDLRNQALRASTRIRRLQLAVLLLSVVVIVALSLLAWRQIRHARRLRITSLTDELTMLPNRRHLMLLASEEFRRSRTDGTGLGVLAIDIDNFKRINDTYGHAIGDAVLRAVALSLTATLRGGDHVGRTGGEEFIALLPRASRGAADDVANRVREAIATIDLRDLAADLTVTASIGVAIAEETDRSFGDVSKRADEMLYQAKAAGRNRVVVAGEKVSAVNV
jgi:diguanylate cyclase (GGDEF)-like protein